MDDSSNVDGEKQAVLVTVNGQSMVLSPIRSEQSTSKRSHGGGMKTQHSPRRVVSEPARGLPPSGQRKFYVGGHNGANIVISCLEELGMRQVKEKEDLGFYLKWVECKSHIDYNAFKPGEQLVNHILNISCLTTKSGLVQSLRDFQRLTSKGRVAQWPGSFRPCPIRIDEFFCETYLLGSAREREKFFRAFKDGDTWICKPSGRNQGKGIFLVRDLSQLDRLSSREAASSRVGRAQEYIIQRYISKPLMIRGFKFDVRSYMLIASTGPHQLVFYHDGYLRVSCVPYSMDNLDIHVHLTNQFIQKKHPLYAQNKESTVLSFDQFNEYLNKEVLSGKGLSQDWVYEYFKNRMKEIMLVCYQSVQNRLERKAGMFDLLGFDFMVDDDMKVWLIEININPALHTNCTVLQAVLPPMIKETLDIVIEVFEHRRSSVSKLESVRSFEPIYNSSTGFCFTPSSESQSVRKDLSSTSGCLSNQPSNSKSVTEDSAGNVEELDVAINGDPDVSLLSA